MSPLNNLLRFVGAVPPSPSTDGPSTRLGSSMIPLPLYSPVTAFDALETDDDDDEEDVLVPAQRHASSNNNNNNSLPSTARFLADFTIGFADGLTVPFALTAGLSSLGQTDTVIYAGMAEMCAGSISMGIGGYLSARGENAAAASPNKDPQENKKHDDDDNDAEAEAGEKRAGKSNRAARYLAPLDLPPDLRELVHSHLHARPDVLRALRRREAQAQAEGSPDDDDDGPPRSPVLAGLSVALGYLLGGSLPLFPYFVVGRVGDGLRWSFALCVLALFLFGFGKDFALRREMAAGDDERWRRKNNKKNKTAWSRLRCVPWQDIRRSAWEGVQMVILGSLAALAAVLCVRVFEGMK